MRLAAGRDVDLAVPGMQHLDGQVRRRPEAEQTDTLVLLRPSDAQAAKADNAGAQQRRCMKVIELCGQWKDEIRARRGILGITTVHVVAGEGRRIAEVLHRVTTV